MSSSSFAPLAEAVPRVFRPFGAPPAAAAAEPAPAPGPSAEEIERAFGAGVERGRAEARAELETIGASFTDSLRELAEFRVRLKDRYERELLELALGVARKVVQQELAERPDIWLGMIPWRSGGGANGGRCHAMGTGSAACRPGGEGGHRGRLVVDERGARRAPGR
jgi:hypothetical protein